MLKTLWNKWKAFSDWVGNIVARIIFTIFYFIILLIPGLIVTLFTDKLKIKSKVESTWIDRKDFEDSLEKAKLQY